MNSEERIHLALQQAYFYLKFRPRTEHEVREYLKKRAKKYGLSNEDISAVIASLIEQKLIDDKTFISWLVDSRVRSKPKSVFALKTELLRFGITKDLIDEYFSANDQDETELATNALMRRWNRLKTLDSKTRFQKAASFLSGRGFSFEVIRKAIHFLETSET